MGYFTIYDFYEIFSDCGEFQVRSTVKICGDSRQGFQGYGGLNLGVSARSSTLPDLVGGRPALAPLSLKFGPGAPIGSVRKAQFLRSDSDISSVVCVHRESSRSTSIDCRSSDVRGGFTIMDR